MPFQCDGPVSCDPNNCSKSEANPEHEDYSTTTHFSKPSVNIPVYYSPLEIPADRKENYVDPLRQINGMLKYTC